MSNTPLFPYEQFRSDIDKWFRTEGRQQPVLRTAWAKLKGLAIVTASVDYGLRPNSTEDEQHQALAKAWEDVYIAFKGYGDNILTGPMLQLWHYTTEKQRKSLHSALTEACASVDAFYNEHSIRRRYLQKYWKANVKSKPTHFQEPTALPISGRPLQDWSYNSGVEPEVMEQVMHEIEVREQSRRALAAQAAPKSRPPTAGPNVIQFPTQSKP